MTTGPYSPPSSTLESRPSDAELGVFVGPNADYYIRAWRHKQTGNWAAFFFAPLWLGYRGMYRYMAVYYGVAILVTLVEEFVFLKILERPAVPRVLTQVETLILASVVGAWANRWYYRHATAKIGAVRSKGYVSGSLEAELFRAGGVSFLRSLAANAVVLVVGSFFYVVLAAALGLVPA